MVKDTPPIDVDPIVQSSAVDQDRKAARQPSVPQTPYYTITEHQADPFFPAHGKTNDTLHVNMAAYAQGQPHAHADPIDRTSPHAGSSGNPSVAAYIIDPPRVGTGSKSRIGGAATMAIGGAVALVGIPMLILPGPGLLAIGGGIALMAKGAKNLLGDKGRR